MNWQLLTAPPTDPAGTVDVPTSWLDGISVGQVVAWILVILAVASLIRQQRKSLRPLENFFRDWNGEEARPGVPERPGVMVRLDRIESHVADAPTRAEFTGLTQAITEIRAEHVTLREQVTRNTAVLDLVVPKRAINVPPDPPDPQA